MKEKPSLKEEIKFKDEIQKVFYSDKYIGFVFKNTNNKKAACVIPRPRSELFQRSSTST